MIFSDRKNGTIITVLYVVLWGFVLYAATFPELLNGDFDVLEEENFLEKANSFLFSLVMIIIVHLIDTSYMLLSSEEMGKDQLRSGLVLNFMSIALLAFLMMGIVMSERLAIKMTFFFSFWVTLLVTKVVSIKLVQPRLVELSKTN